MNPAWKFNDLPAVRVRHDPPSIEEALFAAQGLTDEVEHQIEIAASLMGVSVDDVRPLVKPVSKAGAEVSVANRFGVDRTVVVERKSARTQMRVGTMLPSGVIRLTKSREI